jgi:hypothetical protein
MMAVMNQNYSFYPGLFILEKDEIITKDTYQTLLA